MQIFECLNYFFFFFSVTKLFLRHNKHGLDREEKKKKVLKQEETGKRSQNYEILFSVNFTQHTAKLNSEDKF